MIGEMNVLDFFKQFDQINFGGIFFILLGAWVLTNAVEYFPPRLAERLPGSLRLYILPSVPIVRLIILIGTVFVVIRQVINPSVESMFAVLGAIGLAVGFAFKDYISSLIAGIVTIYEKPYRPGDWITVDNTYGEVRSIGLRTVRMTTPDDTEVIFPHQYLWNSSVHNANDGNRDLMCVTEFFLNPDHDAFLARSKLREVAFTSPFLNLNRPVSVIVLEQPWGTLYKIKAYPIDSRDQFQFISDLTVRGKQALTALGAKAALARPVPVNW